MTPALCTLMADYNRWMNQRLYQAAATLPEAQVAADVGAFFGSLLNTLNHIAVADLNWLHRFAQVERLHALRASMALLPNPRTLTQPLATSLADLQALRSQIDGVIVQLAASITEQDMATMLRYTTTAGHRQAKSLGLVLMHFFNHQTHHRGQASTLLFQAGVDVGVTDLHALIPGAD